MPILKIFLNDLSPGRLLDVGCGDGRLLYQMYQDKWQVSVLDIDAKGIEWAKVKCCEMLNARWGHPDLLLLLGLELEEI